MKFTDLIQKNIQQIKDKKRIVIVGYDDKRAHEAYLKYCQFNKI